MQKDQRIYDLEQRLIGFGLMVIEIVELLPDTRVGKHIADQLIRSGTSPVLNYGEAQVAESRRDFIHKMKICVKELKETNITLQLIIRKPLIENSQLTNKCAEECIELLKIFMKSLQTAKKA